MKATILMIVLFCIFGDRALSQTTEFSYQGSLKDGTIAVTGNYDFEFVLFDSLTGDIQQGSTLTRNAVPVSTGVFSVKLDFGGQFPGAGRFLEIHVRPAGSGSFTVLAPRQQISNAPYAMRSLNAANADTATSAANATTASSSTTAATATNALQLGGLAADQYVLTTDPRMTNARSPVSGSDNYIQNRTTPQEGNFNVSGDGVIGGNVGIGGMAPGYKLNVTGTEIVRARINSDSNGGVSLALGDQAKWAIATVTGGDLLIFNDATSQLAMSVDGSTNVISGNGSGLTNVTAQTTTKSSLLDTLRWHLLSRKTFATGTSPQDVAFDGANIWVINNVSNNVTKLRASDGANLGNFAVGTSPRGIAFDGANIWVANQSSNNVTKLRASDGANLGNFGAGSGPRGLAFDGANIWVANIFANNVTKLRASDGANLGTFTVGQNPIKLAFDGTNIWAANLNSNSVTKLQASNGANLGTFTLTAGPEAIAFGGENIRVAHGLGATKLRPSDGADLGTINFANGGALVFDGTHLWNVNLFGAIGRVRASDGVLVNTFTFGSSPRGAAFDGANIWIASSQSNTVTKFPVFP